MAKSALTVIVVAIFIGLAVFGFVDAFHGGGMHRPGCIASRAMQSSCPENDAFASLAFHLDALRWFSTAEVNGAVLLFALLAAVAAGLAVCAALPAFAVAGGTPMAQRTAFRETLHPATRKFIGWLALREKRDPASRT